MARRPGKAASRKARQRYVPRAAPRPPASPEASAESDVVAAPDAPRRAAAAPDTPSAVGSTLSVRERAEYHYVERDLRNIGILTAVMAVLLVVAWVAFTALGLVG